jgi:hypothetical protein
MKYTAKDKNPRQDAIDSSHSVSALIERCFKKETYHEAAICGLT